MKGFKRITVWIVISIIVQCSVLFYLDQFYFKNETSFKDKIINTEEKPKLKKVDIDVPSSAKRICVSYDGKYLAYTDAEKVKVVNIQTAEAKTVNFEQDVKASYYKWLPDDNRLIIAEKHIGKKSDTLKFSAYDVKKDKRIEINNEVDKIDVEISLPDKKSEVEDIELSTLTNMIYVKIAHSGQRNSIYSINVMAQMQKVKTSSYVIGDIGITPHEDKLIYEDLTYHKIYVTGLYNAISIKGAGNLVLLGVDSEDTIYLGQQENDKVKKIYVGHAKDSIDKWKTLELKTSFDKKNIHVSKDGNIYLNDNLKGVIIQAENGKETKYEGRYFQMFDGGIASISDNKLVITKLKD